VGSSSGRRSAGSVAAGGQSYLSLDREQNSFGRRPARSPRSRPDRADARRRRPSARAVGGAPRGRARDAPSALLNHKAMNLTDKVPKRLQPELRHRLRAVWNAPSRRECELRRDELPSTSTPAAKTRPPRRCSATGTISRPSATTGPSNGSICAGAIRSSRSAPGAAAHERVEADAPARLGPQSRFKITERPELSWRTAQRRPDPHDPATARCSLRRRDLHPG
jgi:hypothetical protein